MLMGEKKQQFGGMDNADGAFGLAQAFLIFRVVSSSSVGLADGESTLLQ